MNARQQHIVELVNRQKTITAQELTQLLGVSVETIRRDLSRLQEKGFLHRTHGGATSLHSKDIGNSFQRRKQLNVSSKRSIVQMAIEYLYQDCVISLDASSTSFYLAQAIPNIPCTVITNSMHNIRALVAKEKIKTIATGGTYSDKYDAFYGPLSETLLQRLHIDIGFFSCSGLDCNGNLWESNELNASIKRKMFNQCEQAFLLADGSKFGRKNLVHLLELNQMDILFTDTALPTPLQQYCHKADLLVSVTESI